MARYCALVLLLAGLAASPTVMAQPAVLPEAPLAPADPGNAAPQTSAASATPATAPVATPATTATPATPPGTATPATTASPATTATPAATATPATATKPTTSSPVAPPPPPPPVVPAVKTEPAQGAVTAPPPPPPIKPEQRATTVKTSPAPPPPPPPPALPPSTGDAAAGWGAPAGDIGFGDTGWGDEQVAARPSYPWLEHHGYFRFRTHYYNTLDLGTFVSKQQQRTSGAAPTLTETASNQEKTDSLPGDNNSLWSSNMRLRYAPTLHLREEIQIRTQLDVLDNLVLGSTPDGAYGRADVPIVFFSGGQTSPSSYGLRDSLQVKALYAWWALPVGELSVGRMPNHWGLGLVDHGGQTETSDYGNYVDRVNFLTQFMGTNASLSMDWVSEGATTASLAQPQGQPRDLDQLDDADQWTFSLYRTPLSEQELATRRKDLDERRVPVYDYGVRFTYRNQDYTTEQQYQGTTTVPLPERQQTVDGTTASFDYELRPRHATLYLPDLWFRLQWRPLPRHYLRLELEGALGWGSVEYLGSNPRLDREEDHARDILLFGGAFEGQYRYRSFDFTLKLGLASGGQQHGFGVLDHSRVPASDSKTDVNNFLFNRDYLVDLLLFKEVIGTVTNAWYIKPTVQYDFIDGASEKLGVAASGLFARALRADWIFPPGDVVGYGRGTPSGEKDLGVELQAGVYFSQTDSFLLRVDYGVLFPLNAFRYREAGTLELVDPSTAHTVLGQLVFRF